MSATNADEAGLALAVNADNWQLPPYNRWAYWHVRRHPADPADPAPEKARALPPAEGQPAAVDVAGVGLVRLDGRESTVGAVLADTYTDALVVLQDGALVAEWYGAEGAPNRPTRRCR